MTLNLYDKKNEPKDTTQKNLFLLDPPKNKMFSKPRPKIKHPSPRAPFNWLVDCLLGATVRIYPGCVTELEKSSWVLSTLIWKKAVYSAGWKYF